MMRRHSRRTAGGEEDLFANHGIVFVVRIISVSELCIWPELELQKFVTKFALVSYVVTKIKLSVFFSRHCFSHCSKFQCSLAAHNIKWATMGLGLGLALPIILALSCRFIFNVFCLIFSFQLIFNFPAKLLSRDHFSFFFFTQSTTMNPEQ